MSFNILPNSKTRTIHQPISTTRQPMPGVRSGADHNNWLQSKQLHDNAPPDLWRIHNKLYDLTSFVQYHPGGVQWIKWTQGTDCTESFESHHLDAPKVEAMLSNFYVRDCNDLGLLEPMATPINKKDLNNPLPTNNASTIRSKENNVARLRALTIPPEIVARSNPSNTFLYDSKGLYPTLKQRVLSTLLQKTNATTVTEATGPTTSMKIACAVIVGQFAVTHTIAARFGSFLSAVLAGVSLVGCWGVGHNAMHQADKTWTLWRYAVDLTTWSSRTTRITHCLSHHQYPNMHQDWEASSIEKVFPFLPDSRGNQLEVPKKLKKSWVIFLAVTAWHTALNKLKWLMDAITKRKGYRNVSLDQWVHALPTLQLFHYVHCQGLFKGFMLFAVQMGTFVSLFTPFAIAVHHSGKKGGSTGTMDRDTAAWQQGDSNVEIDYGRHAIAATSDHSLRLSDGTFFGNYLSLLLFGYLNDHTAHHLFPSIDHSKHYLYRDVMFRTFREFKVEYNTNNVFELVKGLQTLIENKKVNVNDMMRNIG